MKKILQISKYYYPFIGGTEQVAWDIAEVLKGQGFEQKIICFNEDASDGNMVCKKEETVHEIVNGVEVIRCGYFKKIVSQSLSLTFSKELKKILDTFKPDIIILHYPNPFATYYLLKYKKYPFKLLVYWHLDITKQKRLKKLFHGQNKRLIMRSNKILGATPIHVEQSAYSQYFGNKKEILPYAINESRLVISESEKDFSKEIRNKYKDTVLCFFAGRHVPYKGLTYLIESSNILGDYNIHFFIAGQGELTSKLKEQAKGDKKIEFLGRISDSEWRSYLYASDIFCFPSITRNEGFGLALAEGMYFAKPAVTYTIKGSGVNYVNLDGITGIECENRNVVAYADALRKLSENKELRELYGINAKQRILDNFTIEKFKLNLTKLINNIIED